MFLLSSLFLILCSLFFLFYIFLVFLSSVIIKSFEVLTKHLSHDITVYVPHDHHHPFIILVVFPVSGGWPVLSLLFSNPPYPLHPVAQFPSCPPLPRQSIILLACFSLSFYFQLQHSLSPPRHLFLQYVEATSIFSASNAPLNRLLSLSK